MGPQVGPPLWILNMSLISIQNEPFAKRLLALDHHLRRKASLPTAQDVVGRAAEVARRSMADLVTHTDTQTAAWSSWR